MSATGYTPISLYYSTTASAAPVYTNLVNGELAINITDGKLYYKDNTGTVQIIASKAGNVNVSSITFGTTGLTPSTASTGAITVAGTLVGANGGTGVNNGSSTITIGGNFTLSGAYTFTGTLTGNTSLTFPTSGTLSTIIPRVVNTATATSITINGDTTDIATMANTQTAGTFTINAPSGTPANGQKLIFRMSSTAVQTFSWNAIFQGSTDVALPTVSSSGGKYDYMGFLYNSINSKWQMVASNFGF